MSKRNRESRSSAPLSSLGAVVRSLEDEIEDLRLLAQGANARQQHQISPTNRWGDTDEDASPMGRTTLDPLSKPDLPSRPIVSNDDASSEDDFMVGLATISRRDSLTPSVAPTIKKLKTREGPTPEFFVPRAEEGDMSPTSTEQPHLSFFKWARTEEPPATVSPPKGRDEIDPGDSGGAIPAEKPQLKSFAQKLNIFRPVKENIVQRNLSSDSSDIFLEQDTDTETGTKAYAASIFPSFSKSQSFPKSTSSEKEFSVTDETPIVIPIATLVDSKDDAEQREEKKKRCYERRNFWIFICFQLIIVAIVIAIVLSLKKRDDDDNSLVGSALGTETSAPSSPKLKTYTPSAGLVATPAPSPVVNSGDDLSPTTSPIDGTWLTNAPIGITQASLAPTLSPTLIPVTPEFPTIPAAFQDSYRSTLAWFGVDQLGVNSPDLQRFVLVWLWYHTTNNGAVPWTHCNPRGSNVMQSQSCEFLTSLQLDDQSNLCFQSETPADRWLSPTNECNWGGISCSDSGQVTSIKLPGLGLVGNFPFFLNRLGSLEELDLSYGGLQGTISIDWERLSNLRVLNLSHNLFAGLISESLSLLPLESLKLNANMFEGPIPSSFQGLTNILELDLSNNTISGPLPDELGRAVSLRSLFLGDNNLTGMTIPSAWNTLVDLEDLQIQRSGLVGGIPSEFAALTKLTTVDLQSNNMAGPLPAMPWPELSSFDIQENSFNGNFPSEFM